MQGQLFTQDFLTRDVTETPPYQALTDSAFAAFRQALQSIFSGLDGAPTLTADDLLRVNPNTAAAPFFHSQRDANITLGI